MHVSHLLLICSAIVGHGQCLQNLVERWQSRSIARSQRSKEVHRQIVKYQHTGCKDSLNPAKALVALFLASHCTAAFNSCGTPCSTSTGTTMTGRRRPTFVRSSPVPTGSHARFGPEPLKMEEEGEERTEHRVYSCNYCSECAAKEKARFRCQISAAQVSDTFGVLTKHTWQQLKMAVLNPLSCITTWVCYRIRRLKWFMSIALMLVPGTVLAASSDIVLPSGRLWTIPLVAGLLNWATNRLAVKMMFYPLKFRGYRRVGWQGIVPGKATVMANKVVDDVVKRLIDLKIVFDRLPPEDVAKKLEPLLHKVARDVAIQALERRGINSGVAKFAVSAQIFKDTVSTRGRELVAAFVRDVQANPEAVFDIRGVVVRGLASDPKVLVNLFESVGEKDLRFVINSGLFLGTALGVLQMLLWMVWSPKWSLALTGAIVGMVTDQLALNLIFLPVEPTRVGPLTIQGLFLRRQAQVSGEFCSFVAANVLTAKQLWEELLSGSRSASFWRLLEVRVESALGVAPDGAIPNILGQALSNAIGPEDYEWLQQEIMVRLRAELPGAVPVLYDLTERELMLEQTMVEKMGKLSSAEFERVLHPVFEEDEWTLILVGTALGGIAGAAQAFAGI